MNNNTHRYQITKRATLVSALTNALLAIVKIIVGIMGKSQALVADGLHSFSDLFSDALVLLAAKAGGRQPDQEHPYGHQRIETFATIIIALILFGIAGGIIYEAVHRYLSHAAPSIPELPVLFVAVISILANEWLYRYMMKLGQKVQSNLIISNAWHNRSDAFVSTIVLISVLGEMIGFHHLDAIGAVIIALLIFKMGIKMIWNSVKELIDTGVDPKTLEQITQTINQIPGVISIHQLRTRMHGSSIFVDVHILVDPFISVSEGHYIGDQVRKNLLDNIQQICDITVHIDPEDDEISHPSANLPSREQLTEALQTRWQQLPGYSTHYKITLHYLDGRLYVELFIPQAAIPTDIAFTDLVKQYRDSITDIDIIASVVIHIIPKEHR